MGIIAPAIVTVQPHFMEPDVVVAYSQVSGAFKLLPDGRPRVKIGSDDLAVYVRRVDIRTRMASGTAAYNMLPNVTPVFSYISTPTYLTRVRSEWDYHDSAAAGRWNTGIQNLYRLGARQAHFQFQRIALLFGINPALGEGLANPVNGTSINLPPDQNGNSTISTYDNGAMGQFLLQTIGSIKVRTNNIGIGREFVICAPQRVLEIWQYSVVQLVQYQRPGAGSETTAGMVKLVADIMEDEVYWVSDDTLLGKGAGGTDLIIFTMPKLEVVKAPTEINTNEFFDIQPSFEDCVVQYNDMVAPREIVTPIAGGATDCLSENRLTSGWGIRPEAVTLLSAGF
jgi:hypothetical protein